MIICKKLLKYGSIYLPKPLTKALTAKKLITS